MKLVKDELMELRKDCVDLKKLDKEKKIVLEGEKPILLSATMFVGDKQRYQSSFYDFMNKNNVDSSFLDMYIYKLYKEYGISGVIDYIPMEEACEHVMDFRNRTNCYYDSELRNLINKLEIDALIFLNYERFMINKKIDKACLFEQNSSFSYAGITGFTSNLACMLEKKGFDLHMMYGGLEPKQFKKLGIEFTKDVLEYITFVSLGCPRKDNPDRDKLWPRTMDLSLMSSIDFAEFSKIFEEYLVWVNEEIKTKGTFDAMSPMRKL